MDDAFLGRSVELDVLRAAWRADGSAMIPIYGRRRVGKSELILQFLREHRGIYFLGKQAPGPLQQVEFLAAAAEALGDPLLAQARFDSWQAVLQAVVDRWRHPGKLTIALDEFQWTAAASPEIASELQALWDRSWRKSGKVMLILCGSYIGFMEREVLGKKSPLFGRRTAQIHLRPFGYREAALFHPNYSLVDRARAWFLCGGVPLYLRRFDDHASIETNLVREILDPHGPLREEPTFLMREELRDVDRYSAVLGAVAAGRTSMAEIATFTGLPERSLHYYLDGLAGLGYLRKRTPLAGTAAKRRTVGFAIDDPLLRFWFRFVFPNLSYLAHRGPVNGYRDKVRPELDGWFGHAFEQLCREALPRLYEREGVVASFEIGEYWDREAQIDVVSVRSDGCIDVGECKWATRVSAATVSKELAARAAHLPNPRNATILQRAFSRSRPTGKMPKGVRWHTLEDLYA
jgi:uncharacterized protein